jgi:hypothetical protein
MEYVTYFDGRIIMVNTIRIDQSIQDGIDTILKIKKGWDQFDVISKYFTIPKRVKSYGISK